MIDHGSVEGVAAACNGVALAPGREVSRIILEGRDGLDLLHRLSTNDLLRWPQTSMTLTVLTTEKGRIVDTVRVAKYGSGHLLMGSADAEEEVLRWITKYIIADDVAVRGITKTTSLWKLIGPAARETAERWQRDSSGSGTMLFPDETTALPTVYMLDMGDTSDVAARAALEHIPLLNAEEWDLVRILHGIPAHGKELDERFNPYEAGLDRFVSRTKGCYVGQEVLARIETYHKTRKTLAGVVGTGEADELSRTVLRDGVRVGEITSVASLPYGGHRVGLAVLPADAAVPGTFLATERGTTVRVSAFPIE